MTEPLHVDTLRGLRTHVSRLWWAQDGKWLAALSHQWNLAVWEMPSGRLARVFEAPTGGSADNAAVAFFSDGRRLAYVSGKEARILDFNVGQVERAIPLPDGLADQLRLDGGAKRLLLLRRERRELGTGPWRWVLRNLLADDPTHIILKQSETDWSAHDFCLPVSGDWFAVKGRSTVGSERLWSMKVCDLTTGLPNVLFSGPSEPSMRCDTTGRWLLYSGNGWPRPRLRDMHTDTETQWMQQFPYAFDLARQQWSLDGNAQGGCIVFRPGLPQDGLRLAMDWRLPNAPEFSPGGRYLSWGTPDGTVLVADLEEVLQQLNSFRR